MGVCVSKNKKGEIVKHTRKVEPKDVRKNSDDGNNLDFQKNIEIGKVKGSPPFEEPKDNSQFMTSNKNDYVLQSTSMVMKTKEPELANVPKDDAVFKTFEDNSIMKINEPDKRPEFILLKTNQIPEVKFEDKFEENTLENLIEDQSDKEENLEDELFNFKHKEIEPLYNFADFCMISSSEYSTDNDWNQLIKKSKYHNKSMLAIKLLNLNERKWNKENILLSDIIKENREHMDSYLLAKYLNLRLKLQEHFNWIIWAISYYYHSLLLTEINSVKSNFFSSEDFGLPAVDHIDWLNGFEWKGIYIRVMPESESKNMMEEMKALNYLFFEYIQLIDSYKLKNDEDSNKNLLSNELIFPIISYAKICSLVIVGSVTINKYSYDMSEHDECEQAEADIDKNIFNANLHLSNPEYRQSDYFKNNPNNINLNSSLKRRESIRERNPLVTSCKDIKVFTSMQLSNRKNRRAINGMTDRENNKETFMNNDLSNIINNNNSFYSANVSHNINKDINLKSYSRADISESILLSKIDANNLIKVIDDLNDFNNEGNNHNMTQYNTINPNGNDLNNNNDNDNHVRSPKFKFMIISAVDLVPNLVYRNSKKKTFLFSEEDERKTFTFFNADNFQSLNEKIKKDTDVINNSKSLKLPFSPNQLNKIFFKELGMNEVYETSCFNTSFKIFYDKNAEKEKNYKVNDYFLNICSKQLSKNLSTNKMFDSLSFARQKYLKSFLIDNKNISVCGKSLILFSISLNIKLKYSLIKSYKNNKSELIYNENFAEKINYIAYFDRFAKILDLNLSINSSKSLKDFLHRYGINSGMEIFLLPKLKNQKISDLIKADILCKLIKYLFNFHEGINFLVKMNLISSNNSTNSLKQLGDNLNILHDGFFDFINEKSINMVQKQKVYHIINAVLNPTKTKENFLKFFNENLNFIFFSKKLKWKYLDEYIGFNLFNEIKEDDILNVANIQMKKFPIDTFLSELVSSARQKPFIFLNALEHHLNLVIDPSVKFKASIALEQFNNTFNETSLMDTDPSVTSYISCKDLSYYLFTKCIYTSRTSTKYDFFLNKMNMGQNTAELSSPNPNSKNRENNMTTINNLNRMNNANTNKNEQKFTTKEDTNIRSSKNLITANSPVSPELIINNKPKIALANNINPKPIVLSNNQNEDRIYKLIETHKKAQNSSIGRLNSNIKINSNNITKINMINNRYVDSSKANDRFTYVPGVNKKDFDASDSSSTQKNASEKVFMNKKEEEELMIQKAKIWDTLSTEMDISFPPNLYKLLFKYDEKHNTKVVNKYLKSHYSFNKIDTIKNWKSSLEMFLNDIVTVNGSELVIIQAYILLFVHGYFIENDYSLCKEILFKTKEIMKNLMCYNLELMAVINLIEGLIVERKNYIESEEYYSKCLIFSLFLYGEPRGRGNFGNNFMLFPLWKIARQTCILENPLTNENFKEMFHCQDFSYKLSMDFSGNGTISGVTATPSVHFNNLYDEKLNYPMRRDFFKRKQRITLKKFETFPTIKKNSNSNLNISEIDFNENISENESVREENSDTNFHISSKLFNYPHNFKYFPFPSTSDVKTSYNTYFTSENFISFILKNIYNLDNTKNNFNEDALNKLGLNCYSIMNSIEINNKALIQTGSRSSYKKDKTAIFSLYMYEFLMDKLSYKKNHPNNVLLSWGNNSHNETTHNNYDFLSLPRICYKLKNYQIVKISSGWEHNIVMTNDKKCFSWGNNDSGQCGVTDTPVIYHPKLIDIKEKVIELALGNEHSMALTESGDVYSWGKSEDGVLGYMEKEIEFLPKKIPTLRNVLSIAAGSIHNLVIGKDGNVYSWGCSKGGQLGHSENFLVNVENFTGFLARPSAVLSLTYKIKKVSCGEAHSLALTSDGKVYGWGFTSNGQLGMGICEDSFEPGQGMARCRILEPKLIDMNSTKIIDIQCGKTFSTFITNKHEVLVCGINDLSQLGIDQPETFDHLYSKSDAMYNRCYDVVRPTQIEYFLNMKVKKVACGESHCLALIEDLSNKTLSLWSWGSNRFGQLGQGNQIKKSMPKPINYILGYTNSEVVEISCGGFHSLCTLTNNLSFKGDENKETMQIQALIRTYSNKWKVE